METPRRSLLIYALLLATWVLLLAWQVAEHLRVKESARVELINRAKDISTTVGIVLRSQRHFGVISKERLESALTDLVKPGELNAVAVLNAAGDVVVAAGDTNHFLPTGTVRLAELWASTTVTLMNLVDLGSNVTQPTERTNPPIVLSRQEMMRPFETNRPPRQPPPESALAELGMTNPSLRTNPEFANVSTNRSRGRGGEGRPRFNRPPWMNEGEYQAMIEKQGVHSFVIVLSTESIHATSQRDLWLRSGIGLLATVAVVGLGLAWRNLGKSADLQIRLVRASELNSHLKEMNLAAAGLAHETRNPLNIIRGLAQMISQRPDAPPEIQGKSREILDETDRVTAQLNEFINYSRPREVRRSALALNSVVAEVVRALNYDLEERHIRLQVTGGPLTIEADEQLLRQALFNLVLNAVQAVADGGEIVIHAEQTDPTEARLEIRDNGPGVPAERRTEIFKPYFTTHQKGTGLGLAVVQQIILAHGWEITCLGNEPHGAIFRISHLKLAA
jgi:signal transduction histidine kinase